MPDFEDPPTEPKLDNNLSDRSQRQPWHHKAISIVGDSVEQQRHDSQVFGPKIDGKVREEKDKKGIKGRQEGEVKPVVRENSISKANIYRHIMW